MYCKQRGVVCLNHLILNATLLCIGGFFGFLYGVLNDFEIGFYLLIGFITIAVIHFGWMCFVAPNEYSDKEIKN